MSKLTIIDNPYVIYLLHFTYFMIIDEDMAGDYLLAEAKFPLNHVFPQMQKKFQIYLEKPDFGVSLILLENKAKD